jgi:hypothetical protein
MVKTGAEITDSVVLVSMDVDTGNNVFFVDSLVAGGGSGAAELLVLFKGEDDEWKM